MSKMNENLRFEMDPFHLFPLKDEMLDTHFVDRDQEKRVVNSMFELRFKDSIEICAVIGGTGIGKSSMLNLIGNLAAKKKLPVEHLDGPDAYREGENGARTKRLVTIIDNVDKVDDERALAFYTALGKPPPSGSMIFFSDTYDRSGQAIHLRRFTITQTIALPQRLGKDQLKFFLEERMRNCLPRNTVFKFPFSDEAIDVVSIRSRGNLRTFFNYAKHAWVESKASDRDMVGVDDVRSGIITLDRALLGGCDIIDMKILWYTTIGDMNKALLAHRCDVNYRTLESHIEHRLSEVIVEDRNKKEIAITSVYRHIPGGQEVLTEIIKGLGFHMTTITGTKE
jgi:hypothetical protein